MAIPSESPTTVMETVWLIEATYAPDAAETRIPFRAEHLARVAALKASGVIVEIGAFLDVSGAIAMIRADSESAALDIMRADVYVTNGIWVELRARPFGRVVG
jgi:uncharacterized protein